MAISNACTPRSVARRRFQTLNSFIDVVMRVMPRGPAMTWLVLFRDVKPNGLAKTSVVSIAKRVGANRRTILRALRRLEKAGFIEVVIRGGLNRGASIYRIHVNPLKRAETEKVSAPVPHAQKPTS
jgi:DNA-binding transcriptional regulator PaaX